MTNLKSLSMAELINMHNELAAQAGTAEVDTFKTLAAGRVAIVQLQEKIAVVNSGEAPAAEDDGMNPKSGAKYNSSGKRGPTQGVGAYAKTLILAGQTNAEVLAAVLEQFPTAKTSNGCIAYYRTALAKAATAAAPAVEATEEATEEALV